MGTVGAFLSVVEYEICLYVLLGTCLLLRSQGSIKYGPSLIVCLRRTSCLIRLHKGQEPLCIKRLLFDVLTAPIYGAPLLTKSPLVHTNNSKS